MFIVLCVLFTGQGSYAKICTIVFHEDFFFIFSLKAIFSILHLDFVYKWFKTHWSTLNLSFVKVINYKVTILTLPDRRDVWKICIKRLKNTEIDAIFFSHL